MLAVYWGLFFFGVIFAGLMLVFGGIAYGASGGLFHALPDAVHPLPVVGGLTVLGGTGMLLSRYTAWPASAIFTSALLLALLLSLASYFLYVRPMRKAENSIGYSIRELAGHLGEISVPVPAGGFGEVQVRLGKLLAAEIAASLDGVDIPAGTKVVVVEERDHVLYVTPLELN